MCIIINQITTHLCVFYSSALHDKVKVELVHCPKQMTDSRISNIKKKPIKLPYYILLSFSRPIITIFLCGLIRFNSVAVWKPIMSEHMRNTVQIPCEGSLIRSVLLLWKRSHLITWVNALKLNG